MPKIAPVAVVSIFEGVGGLACVGTVEDLLVLGLVVRLVVIAGGLAGRGLAAAAVARPPTLIEMQMNRSEYKSCCATKNIDFVGSEV